MSNTNKSTTEEKVIIKLPLSRMEKDDVYVGLNGRSFLIKRGEEVEVPVGVAEILARREDMIARALEYEMSSANFAQ